MILVTGGAGLIGSACIEELNAQGIQEIYIVDHLGTSEKWQNLRRLRYADYEEKEDFLARFLLSRNHCPTFSHVLHLGACSSTLERDASYLVRNNYEFTKRLAEWAVERGIPFVYASSAATYGNGEKGYSDTIPLRELKPLNMYGYSKHMFDLYAERRGLLNAITGLKYFNVFGYGENHKGEMRSLVLKGYQQIEETDELRLFKSYRPEYKDGEQKRDFLYVKDAAKISVYFLFHRHPGIFNVGRGIAETWKDLASSLFQAMNKPVNIRYIDMPESLRDRYQYYTCADTNKLLATGYNFGFTNLEDACREYVELLRS